MHIQHSTITRLFVATQIAGAAFAVVTLATITPVPGSGIIGWALFILLLFVAVSAFVGGIAYWYSKSWGYYVTIAVYVLQLIHISSEVITYKLSFGIAVAINLIGPEGWLNVNFGSQTICVLWPGLSATSISLNIFAGFGLAFIIENARKSSRATAIASDPNDAKDIPG